MKRVALFVVLALAGAAAGYAAWHYTFRAEEKVEAAELAPDVRLPDLTGQPHALSDYRGKLVLVNFWATWCKPCRLEIPLLIQLQTEYGPRGLQVLGPTMDSDEEAKNGAPQLGLNYPVLIGMDAVAAAMTALGDELGALPFSVLIDQQGRIVARKHGEFEAAELTALVEKFLQPASNSP